MNLEKKSNKSLNVFFNIVLVAACVLVGAFVGSTFFSSHDNKFITSSDSGNLTDLSKLNNVINTLDTKFYYSDRLKSTKIEDTAIKGLLSGLDDFPTRYLNTQEYSQYKDTIGGNIYGIGIEIGPSNEGSKVFNVYEGTPAEKAGVKKNDVITKVDDTDTSKMAPGDIATLVRGAAGTKVKITVLRNQKEILLEITRDKIYTNSVIYKKIDNEPGLCKIDIKRFTDETLEKWRENWNKAVAQFQQDNCQNLILDLRGNGGGFVEAARYAIEEFIPDNQIIYGQRSRDGSVKNILSTRDREFSASPLTPNFNIGKLRNTKLVVLINSTSASASEILSGSLQTTGRAKLIGINSFGKGSVQDTQEFNDGSALIYTIANWTLPNGQVIDQNFPIKPDYVISADKDNADKDVQLNKAIEIIKN